MTEMGSYNDNFSAFIHKPNAVQFMLPEEKATVMSFQMKGKFIDGYNINQELYTLLSEYFLTLTQGWKLYFNSFVKHSRRKRISV